MDNSKSSYEFHNDLEGFFVFCRRQWKAIAICGGFFCAAVLAAIAFVDPAFFYPRLSTDPLNYYLKAKSLAETGTTSATWAVNLEPFAYASMPGVLRAPFILLFDDFDNQLRSMQVFNMLVVASVALMSAYIFSWVHPPRRHPYVIAFAFAFTLLSPIWLANAFLPLADAPYAAFSLGALLAIVSIVCAPHPLKRKTTIAAAVVLFVVAFTLRFTAPVLLVFAAVLAYGRWGLNAVSRKVWLTVVAVIGAFMIFLITLNAEAIFGRYFFEPLWYWNKADKVGIVANIFAVAFPSQVLPNFQLGFVHPPIDSQYSTKFTSSWMDLAWMMFGLLISAVIVSGLWKSRNRLLPEIAYVLVPLPILALILPSATRYTMSYQAFIWLFFTIGAVAFARRTGFNRVLKNKSFVISASVVLIAGVVGLRWWKMAGTASERVLAISITSAPGYINAVGSTFRGLRHFLETLPAERTLLIGDRGTVGRWKIIAGLDYYAPDPSLPQIVESRDVYLLAECGILDTCQSWDHYRNKLQTRVREFGNFRFDSVYAAQSPRAHVEVFRVRNSFE